jgi:hypothetical protein
MIDFLVYALSGKLLIWLTRKFPPIRSLFQKWEFSRELFDCDLCLGFWVFLGLSVFFNINVEQIENKLVGNIMLSGFTTFVMYLLSIGWQEVFGEYVIDAPG